MTEGKVNWHYTCPICEKRFDYCFAAGPAEKLCKKCEVDVDTARGFGPHIEMNAAYDRYKRGQFIK